ncbi:MAG: PEP-CTERM sorting domain-containing protein [Pirellulales bacterium]|nr:PEP-CTERM sorting domain-containing protein [Pirellulales bacterium]
MSTCRCVLGAVALLLLLVGIAQAETVTLDASDRGWYLQDNSDTGHHDPDVHNYMVGRYTATLTSEFRNFYVFDLTDITDNITSATLKVNVLGITGSETYELYHVETSVGDLTAGGSNLGDIFADLGSGTAYGSREILYSEADTYVEISLDADFLSDANDASGMFAIGGALTTLDTGTADEYVFGYYGERSLSYSQLVVETIPEPGTIVLLLTGVAAMFAFTRGRRMRRA